MAFIHWLQETGSEMRLMDRKAIGRTMMKAVRTTLMLLLCLALLLPLTVSAEQVVEETKPVEHLLYSPETGSYKPLSYVAVYSPDGGMLNLREGQSKDAAVMLQLKGGFVMPLYEMDDTSWPKVKAAHQMGYALKDYLYQGADLEKIRPFTQVMSVQPPRGQGQLPLLELPFDKAMVLAQLDAGQAVIVVGQIREWRIVRAGNATGYVKADYLKMEIDAFGPGQEGDHAYNGDRHLERGLTVSAVFREELFDLYTAFVSLDFDPGYTTVSDITAFDLYINHKLIARIPPMKQEDEGAPRVFTAEVPFKHPIGAVALVPVNDRGEQMMEDILFLGEGKD